MFPRVGLLVLALVLVPLASADIGVGDSRAQVLEQLGQPVGHARLGDREILQYPHGGEVELRDGRVTEVVGPLPASAPAVTYTPPTAVATNEAAAAPGPAAPANAAAAAPATAPTSSAPGPANGAPAAMRLPQPGQETAATERRPPAAAPGSRPTAAAQRSSASAAPLAPPFSAAALLGGTATPTGSSQSLVNLTEQMEAQSGTVGTMRALNQQMAQISKQLGPGAGLALPMPGDQPKHPFGAKFAVALLLHFAATLFALRLAFKIEEMDALWSGVLAISAIDLAIYATLEALGPATSGLSSMIGIESGVCALVMVGTIQKFCFNKKLQYAVVTAMAVKTVVQLCDLFLFPLALHALFH